MHKESKNEDINCNLNTGAVIKYYSVNIITFFWVCQIWFWRKPSRTEYPMRIIELEPLFLYLTIESKRNQTTWFRLVSVWFSSLYSKIIKIKNETICQIKNLILDSQLLLKKREIWVLMKYRAKFIFFLFY